VRSLAAALAELDDCFGGDGAAAFPVPPVPTAAPVTTDEPVPTAAAVPPDADAALDPDDPFPPSRPAPAAPPWHDWFAWRRRVVADPGELEAWIASAGGVTGDGVAWLPEGLPAGKALEWLTASVAERDLRLRWRS
jgi:hypothetical protein